MTIERYTNVPSTYEYLAVDQNTTLGNIRDFVWAYVTVEGNSLADGLVDRVPVQVGNRVGREGNIYNGAPGGMQLVTLADPEFVLAEKA